MDCRTHINVAINSVKGNPKLDSSVKEVLADKQILARIMKRCVKEFAGMSMDDIMESIIGVPEVERVAVEPGETNASNLIGKVVGENAESNIQNEGQYYFDIKFSAIARGDNNIDFGIKLILDVEAQLDYYVGYDLVTRGIFYGSRMISSQSGVEFYGEDFSGLKKVYSIWICMNPPKYGSNSIVDFKIVPEKIYGKIPQDKIDKMKYDLLEVVLVYISSEEDRNKDELCGMLQFLLNKNLSIEERLEELEKGYQVKKTAQLVKEVKGMCDYSVGIIRSTQEEDALKHISSLMKKTGWSLEEAMDALEIPIEEKAKYEELLGLVK